MRARNTKQRGGGDQSKVKRLETRLRAAYFFMFLIPVYSWILGGVAMPLTVSLTLVTLISVILIFKVHDMFLECIDIEENKKMKIKYVFLDQQEALNILLQVW